MSFGRWWFDSNWCQEADPEAKAVGDWFLCSQLGLSVGWPNQRQADDGTGGEEEPRAGQGSEHILLFGLPFLFACSGVKHLDVISVQPPLWACSCGSFKPLSPEAARMGRADGKSSRKEEMGNKKLLAPFIQGKVRAYPVQHSLHGTILCLPEQAALLNGIVVYLNFVSGCFLS